MRIALAGALFAAPDILLLDEPSNYLDRCRAGGGGMRADVGKARVNFTNSVRVSRALRFRHEPGTFCIR